MPGLWSTTVGRFFGWWFGELAALVPAPLRRPLRWNKDLVVLDLSGAELVVSREGDGAPREIGRVALAEGDAKTRRAAALLRKANARKSRVSVRLAGRRALRKTIELPLAAEENLREVLSFEMDRHTPFKADQVYYDYRVIRRDVDQQRIAVDLGVAPRPVVDEAVATVAAWGVVPDVVEIEGDREPGRAPLNLLAGELATGGARPATVVTAVLAIAAVVLAAAAVYLPLERQQRVAEAWSDKVVEARVAADASSQLRQELDSLLKGGRYVRDQRRRVPMAVRVIDELTRLLPDQTYIFQLQIRADEVQISGYSTAAAELIGVLETSPLLRNAKFRSPVTQDAREGRERFQISVELLEAGD